MKISELYPLMYFEVLYEPKPEPFIVYVVIPTIQIDSQAFRYIRTTDDEISLSEWDAFISVCNSNEDYKDYKLSTRNRFIEMEKIRAKIAHR